MNATETKPAPQEQRQFKEQARDEGRDDARLTASGSLRVFPDEDAGSDPYNRTGRFKKAVR